MQTDTDVEEGIIEGDVGSLLMLCRTFLSPRAPDDDWCCTTLFTSTRMITGKVFHFIIDFGHL